MPVAPPPALSWEALVGEVNWWSFEHLVLVGSGWAVAWVVGRGMAALAGSEFGLDGQTGERAGSLCV